MTFPVIDCNSLDSHTNYDLTFSGKMSNNRNKMVIGLIMVSLYLNSLNKILHRIAKRLIKFFNSLI